jgi:hypothetical protein
MGAQTTEGTGFGSAEGPLRGYSLDYIHKVFIGPLTALKTCVDFTNNRYILRINASDVNFNDSNVAFSAENVQEAIEFLSLNSGGSLQDAYDNSSPPQITLDSLLGSINIRDNLIPLGTELFSITDNSGTIPFLTVNDNSVDLQELRFLDSGFYLGFNAPALTSSTTWTLPSTDGLNSQFLRTDGAGNLSWGTAAGGSSNRFSIAFTSASSGTPIDYSAGILTVTHSLGEQYCGSVTVTDDNDDIVIPDNINMTSTTVTTISLISFHPIPGTWHVTILA